MRHSVLHHGPPPQPPAITHADGIAAKLAGGFFLAAALAALLAHWARRRGLAWTWSLLSLLAPLAILAALVGGALAPSPGAFEALSLSLGAVFGAVGLSARSRYEDRRAGADRELEAKRRRGIGDLLGRRLRERGWARGASCWRARCRSAATRAARSSASRAARPTRAPTC